MSLPAATINWHVSSEQWREVASRSYSATFFHTPYWSEVAMAADTTLQSATFAVTLKDGAVAIYPLLRRRRLGPFTADVYSTFAGCYGGPVCTRMLESDELQLLHLIALKRGAGRASVTLGPFTPHSGIPRCYSGTADSTHILDVRRDPKSLVRDFSKGHRAAFRRALREGVEVRPAAGPEDLARYLEMYKKTVERWGTQATSRYPPRVFAKVFELADRNPHDVRIWFVLHGNAVVAGGLFFCWRGRWIPWHTAAPELGAISYATAMYAHVIHDAAESGSELIDFNPSGGHLGVAAFKQHFGAMERPVLRLRYLNPIYRALEKTNRSR